MYDCTVYRVPLNYMYYKDTYNIYYIHVRLYRVPLYYKDTCILYTCTTVPCTVYRCTICTIKIHIYMYDRTVYRVPLYYKDIYIYTIYMSCTTVPCTVYRCTICTIKIHIYHIHVRLYRVPLYYKDTYILYTCTAVPCIVCIVCIVCSIRNNVEYDPKIHDVKSFDINLLQILRLLLLKTLEYSIKNNRLIWRIRVLLTVKIFCQKGGEVVGFK